MIPYASTFFFYTVLLFLIPAVILGFLGKKIKYYGLIFSVVMVYLAFYKSKYELYAIIFYFIYESLLCYGFLFLNKKGKKKALFITFLILTLLPLISAKYLFGPFKLIGFMGISYLSFRSIQLIIEIYLGLIKEISFIDYAYFILFFPTFTSGPIDRMRRFSKDVNSKINYGELLGKGISKLILGAGYKFVAAYLINTYFLMRLPINHSLLNTIKYMYGYSLYLFFDFAGYSLMAIGISYILGVRVPENFNLPFLARDMKDFWNRWHMSLSFFFRDYIYNRFMLAAIKKHWFKNKKFASHTAYLITMTTMGFWHGLRANYICYGLYQGIVLILTDEFENLKFYKDNKDKLYFKAVQHFVTLNLICFGFLIFSGYLF